jgi:hypothetical protein
MVTKNLPTEYQEMIKHLSTLARLADAFSSTDERLSGIAAVLGTTNAMLQTMSRQLEEIRLQVAAGGGYTPSGAPQVNVNLAGLDDLVQYNKNIPVFWGTATNGTITTLTHNGQSWESNVWANCQLAIISGKGAGQIRIIASNDRDTLTLRSAFNVAPDSTSVYVIRMARPGIANAVYINHGQKDVTTAGTAVQLSSNTPVAEGFMVTILAKPTNAGRILLGKTQALAQDTSNRFDGLTAGMSVSLAVTNLNSIWIDATINGEGVSWIVEATS